MKEVDQRKATKNSQTKHSGRTERRDPKLSQGNTRRTLNRKETKPKASSTKLDSSALVNGSNVGKEPSEVYENVVVHYVDDCNRSEEGTQDLNANIMVPEECSGRVVDDCSSDGEKKPKNENEEVSDSETIKDSVSSHADSVVTEDEKVERVGRDSKSIVKKTSRESIERSDSETTISKSKPNTHTPKKSARSSRNASRDSANNASLNNSKNSEASPKPSPECSDGFDDKPREETKENDTLDEASNGTQSIESDNGSEENAENEDEAALEQKIEEMETKIEKLEEELREVAALEISLYSVVPQHGSSAHKVHTPARRLSRLYLHACKHWTLKKRGRIAKNTLSGLVLIAKSCANDVPRLTFWLSNTAMLREIISQTFGKSCYLSPLTRFTESHGNGNIGEVKATTAPKGNGNSFMQFVDGWQETGTFTAALQNVESWIYCRILESVWWQAFTPYMQSPVDDLSNSKNIGKLLGPTLGLGDQQQGSFSVNLWRNAFKNASHLLCPVRAAGHECGCLPVLARMVMEQCVSRLDVAMFNAILRESAHEIPTDPVSDPIIEPKVLPIPAGDLSFGSGAQLKNYVGNWSRWLTDMFDMDAGCASREDHHYGEDIDRLEGDGEPKPFILLNDLSDLLMLPKDMLIDRSIRNEVCPSISLPLVKRILCNFTPDEFCPNPVPGAVLEALNSESIVEQRLSEDSTRSFPYAAAPVVYTPPSAVVVVKIAEAGSSIIQRKGYTSDEELEELDCPLSSIVDQSASSSNAVVGNVNGKYNVNGGHACINARYELLREVWSV